MAVWCDVTGKELDAEFVAEAIPLRFDYFKMMVRYCRTDRCEQRRTCGKVIHTRWLDANRWDSKLKDARGRSVGKGISHRN